MKKRLFILATALLVVSTLCPSLPVSGEDDVRIWKEFVSGLKEAELSPERLRPYRESFREPLLGFLKEMRAKASWAEWNAVPKVFRVGNRVHFLIPLTFNGETATYCFSFLEENNRWFFQHLEGVTIRLDQIGTLPASQFPDLPETQKAWMREELRWSREVWLFNFFASERGKTAALDFFKDGDGYFMAAKVWVPYLEPERAFILYACWEQANLRGNAVTLEKLDEREATIRMQTIYFELYKKTAHLKQQIAFDDYRQLFETIWRDRARAAGWDLEISYSETESVLRFTRKS